MSAFLYKNFLNDKQEYLALRAFWIRKLNEATPSEEKYEAYANDKFANGTFFFDGNPIASAINWKTRRAVRIVQESPAEFGEYYVSWASTIHLQKTDQSAPATVVEKVIALTLTKATLERSLREIQEWLRKK